MMESKILFSPADFGQSASNVPVYSVSDISGAIKRTLEGAFRRVRVRGEITEMKRYASGHVYLSLKDEGGRISGVIWRGSVSRLGMVPENGTEVIATGRVSSYGERSNYQLIIERMEYAGEGALLARIEKLRVRLRNEGLFSVERKREIPFLPLRVGVITSRSGAVLHDICTTISRRFPREIILWPVAVQGDSAARQIVHALEGIHSIETPPDLVILARGGGSLEDLMCFNDEGVVRAVAECPIPLISAVGHETDTTLVDYASDRRAPTPTAAAEMAVPVRSELLADLAHRTARLSSGISNIVQSRRMMVRTLGARLPDLPAFLDTQRMRLDDRGQRLELALPTFVMKAKAFLHMDRYRLPSAEMFLERQYSYVRTFSRSMHVQYTQLVHDKERRLLRTPLRADSLQSRVSLQKARLEGVRKHLLAVSPKALLERGYVLVQDAQGHAITCSAALPSGSQVELLFCDGKRQATLDSNMPFRKKTGRHADKRKGSLSVQRELEL